MKTISAPKISYSDLEAVANQESSGFNTYGNLYVSDYLDRGIGRLSNEHASYVYDALDNDRLGAVVYSYSTPIAVCIDGLWEMLYARYSATSTKSFNRIARLLGLHTLAQHDKHIDMVDIYGEDC
jgi:hypothetical protein